MILFTIVVIGLLCAIVAMPLAYIALGIRELEERGVRPARARHEPRPPLPSQRRYA